MYSSIVHIQHAINKTNKIIPMICNHFIITSLKKIILAIDKKVLFHKQIKGFLIQQTKIGLERSV